MSGVKKRSGKRLSKPRASLVGAVVIGVSIAMLSPLSSSAGGPDGKLPTARGVPGFTAAHARTQLQLEGNFLTTPDPKRVEKSVKYLSEFPGEDGNPDPTGVSRRGNFITKELKSYGLDVKVQTLYTYMASPENVRVSLEMKAPTKKTLSVKEIKQPWQKKFDQISVGFNEGTPPADITKQVVYANFGRDVDYNYLSSQGISVNDKIVLVRAGSSQRSEVAYQAYAHHAAGVVMYSDPQQDGFTKGTVYPQGPWRPADGIQRGTVNRWTLYPGDPLTPGYASTKTAPRIPVSESNMGQIPPITSIGYGAASELLTTLTGPMAPQSWQGGLPFTYRLGTGRTTLHMKIDIDYQSRPFKNIIATIPGRESPEKVTVLGNHYDTWAYGAFDPTEGAAVQLETARGLGKLVKSGWQPKRTIALGFWGAEERGIVGSTEWTELLGTKKMAQVVAYLNTDVIAGPGFNAVSVPALDDLIFDTTKRITWPGTNGSLYDAWTKAGGANKPVVSRPGGGTDFMAFLNHFGAPIVSFDGVAPGTTGRYHCTCDDFYSLKKFNDPDFTFGTAIGNEKALVALRLTQADVLPFNYSSYATETAEYLRDFDGAQKTKFGNAVIDLSASIDSAQAWADAATKLESARDTRLDRNQGARTYEKLNDTLMQAERTLLTANGLPDRPWFKHQIYAAQFHNGFAIQKLPGLYDALMVNEDPVQATEYQNELHTSLSAETRLFQRGTQ